MGAQLALRVFAVRDWLLSRGLNIVRRGRGHYWMLTASLEWHQNSADCPNPNEASIDVPSFSIRDCCHHFHALEFRKSSYSIENLKKVGQRISTHCESSLSIR
ncbi:hypothetical protein HYPSUDRAFT_38331 [Hypholoma sublateritium FD-334 SS-4]|uniref:Uncharacterized protein n=1 Tax=Hypholoma sublateritium (strain FD-334 SS-4) TaxID=945553 RepID=A0A0D2P1X2_HYPSF|nr:hypothetical protein HYPSUDRAFT_38331 [Hypholoma sublateritium FD-334 SS-4]